MSDPDTDDPTKVSDESLTPYSPTAIARARGLLETMPERIGRYRILERIGGGGMGEVYVAEQTEPIKRRVAVKLIKAGMDTKQVVARFEAERQALAMMDHPNIARVIDAGATDTGRPYFVMELVRGIPITKFADDNKLTTRQRVELLIPICQAVQHAHQKGIIHRDIKPHNVLVTLHDGKPVPKVIDFGIAKATSQALTDKTIYTEFRQMIGTPAYMSPEQAEMSGLDIDTRSDIYSLGVLAYELLTGSPPFENDRLVKAGLAEIQRIIKEEDPPRPSIRLSTIGDRLTSIAKSRDVEPSKLSKLLAGELDWIVMRAMEKDRKRRYDTATDLAADFNRHLSGEPVVAAPPTWTYRIEKFVKKRKAPVAAGVALATLLCTGVIATTTQMVRATKAERATLRKSAELLDQKNSAELEAYTADLALAQSAMANGNWPEARARLDACPESKRGWEWTFLRKQAGEARYSALRTILAFSRDGKTFLARDLKAKVQSFVTASGKPLGKILVAVPDENNLRRWSISNDGNTVAEGWDGADDGRYDHLTRVWNSESGDQICVLRDGGVRESPAVSPDGRWVATLTDSPGHTEAEHSVLLWELPDGTKPAIKLNHPAPVTEMCFSPDGGRIVTICDDNSLRIWDEKKGVAIGEVAGVAFQRNRVFFSPDGTQILVRGWSGQQADIQSDASDSLDLYDGFSGKLLHRLIDRGKSICTAFFNQDGSKIVVVNDGTFRLWNAASGLPATEEFPYDNDYADFGWFTSDGDVAIAWNVTMYSDTAGATFWTENGTKLGGGELDTVTSIDCPNGNLVFLFDSSAMRSECRDKVDSSIESFGGALSSADRLQVDSLILAAIYDSASLPTTNLLPQKSRLGDDGYLHIGGDTDGKEAERIGWQNSPITAYAFSPDGTRLVTSDGTAIKFYKTDGWQEVAAFVQNPSVAHLQFTPDGTRLIVQFADGSAQIWDARPLAERQKMWARRAAERTPAREYVAKLLASAATTQPADLKKLIRDDASITPLRKLVALEALDLEILRREREAKRQSPSTRPATQPATMTAK